jgi:hypothetical protein
MKHAAHACASLELESETTLEKGKITRVPPQHIQGGYYDDAERSVRGLGTFFLRHGPCVWSKIHKKKGQYAYGFHVVEVRPLLPGTNINECFRTRIPLPSDS